MLSARAVYRNNIEQQIKDSEYRAFHAALAGAKKYDIEKMNAGIRKLALKVQGMYAEGGSSDNGSNSGASEVEMDFFARTHGF